MYGSCSYFFDEAEASRIAEVHEFSINERLHPGGAVAMHLAVLLTSFVKGVVESSLERNIVLALFSPNSHQ